MQNFKTFRYLALVVLIGFAQSAQGNDEESQRKLFADYDFRQHVQDTAGQSSVVVQNPPCPSVDVHILPQIVVYKPLKFDATGSLTEGMWKMTVTGKGCGTDRTLNVLLLKQRNSSSLELHPMLPGTTHADYQLQVDARPYVQIAVGEKEANCKKGYMEDTQFIGFTGNALPGARERPWDEIWTMAYCTKRAAVTMHFIPDKTGTKISATPSETKYSTIEGHK